MHLVQILLPLYDNEGRRFPQEPYRRVRTELAERFGGLTAFTRAPAEGLWTDGGETSRDEIVTFEVMVDDLDRDWWQVYRRELEARFRQDVIVVRAQAIEQI
ncbi:MAG TPA: hypothetical protein VF601_03010 [Beijerinckiaceae bacterium]|jgi:hypothetical protein